MNTVKTILACALLALAGNAFAQKATLTAADVNLTDGKGTLTTNMTTDVDMANWQMILHLPAGISIEKDQWGELIDLNDRYPASRNGYAHQVSVTTTASGNQLITCFANPTQLIKERSGELCKISLVADATFAGTGTITITDIVGSTADAVRIPMDGEVKVAIGTTTGISAVRAASADAPAYDLAGRRVNAAAKGIYIQNGKKVVIK